MTIHPRALALAAALILSACGGGGSGGGATVTPSPGNTAPTANFAVACVDLACAFTSTSTDQDVGDAIALYGWTFGDASAGSSAANPSHTFAAAGSYDVTLAVADRSNVLGSIVRRVTVSAPPAPAAPHASFSASCVSLDCTFVDTSTFDAGSVFQSRTWDFGDGTTLPATSPASHRYAATTVTTFNVSLSVSDAAGKTSTSTKSLVAAPPATTLNCVGGNCTLALSQAATVTATLVSHSCSAQNNQVVITAPVAQTIFTDGCFDPVGTVVQLGGGTRFAAGTELQVAVLSGTLPASTLAFTPSIRVSGNFETGWTLTFDDGYGGPGEPDFNDLLILVKATP